MDIDINAHPELICHLNCLQKDYTMHLTLRQKIIAYMETEQWALFVKQMFIIRGMIIMPRFLFLFFFAKKHVLKISKEGRYPQVAETVFILLLRSAKGLLVTHQIMQLKEG